MKNTVVMGILLLVGLVVGVLLSPRLGFFAGNRNGNSNVMPRGNNQLNNQKGQMNNGNLKGNCLADGCLAVDNLNYPVGTLGDTERTALTKALDDEYKAWATYDAVIKKFGNVRPFIMIVRAEEQHISSLKALFDKYGLDIPENSYVGKVTAPDTLANACSLGVEAETSNAALYEKELSPQVGSYEDITLVFTNLMNASKTNHLPAFTKCSN